MTDIPAELAAAAKRVSHAASKERSPGVVGRAVDGVTHGSIQVAKELTWNLPVRLAVKPGGKLLLEQVKKGAKQAIRVTTGLLRSIPLIPFRRSSKQSDDALALSVHELDKATPPSLQGPDNPGGGTGQTPRRADCQSGSA